MSIAKDINYKLAIGCKILLSIDNFT